MLQLMTAGSGLYLWNLLSKPTKDIRNVYTKYILL